MNGRWCGLFEYARIGVSGVAVATGHVALRRFRAERP